MINRDAVRLRLIFFTGTMANEVNGMIAPSQGSLYRVNEDLESKKEISPVSISNGLAWNIEDNTFYYIDSPTRQVAAYDYNPVNGTICKIFHLKLWYKKVCKRIS